MTSNLILHAHQLFSLEEAQRQTLEWNEQKDIASLHVSHKRILQLDEDRRLQHVRKQEQTSESRLRTVQRKLVALDGEEQKERLSILKAELLHLEAVVRFCSKAVRGEVFNIAQEAQQRVKYFNKTLDVILKKEGQGRRDLLSSERYEFLLLKQKLDKSQTEAQRQGQISRLKMTKQQQHDRERLRKEEHHANSSKKPLSREPVAPHSILKKEGTEQRTLEENNAGIAQEVEHHEAPPSADAGHSPEEAPKEVPVSVVGDSGADESGHRSRSSSRSSSSASRSRSASPASSHEGDAGPPNKRSEGKDEAPKSTTTVKTQEVPQKEQLGDGNKRGKAAAHFSPASTAASSTVRYAHVAPQVVLSHPPEFFERALREVAAREEIKRLEIESDFFSRSSTLMRHFSYLKGRDEQRQAEIALLLKGHPDAVERWIFRGRQTLSDSESKARARVEEERLNFFEGMLRQVGRAILQDRNDQALRLAKYHSHSNRIQRKLQKLDAERNQLSHAAKESVALFMVDGSVHPETDQALAAAALSQPFPAPPPDVCDEGDDTALSAKMSAKLVDMETKRRRFVEREAMLRRMVLQIFHRQKMKDFGYFDESRMREEQMKLAKALEDEEFSEALKQLEALDSRIALAQWSSQQRILRQREREKLIREEQMKRNELSNEQFAELDGFQRLLRTLQRLQGTFQNLFLVESQMRKKCEDEEKKKREAIIGDFARFKPRGPRKPVEPLPVPPADFAAAMQLYQVFFKKQPKPPKAPSNQSKLEESVDRSTRRKEQTPGESPTPLTSYFSLAGRNYLPPPKKTHPKSIGALLLRDTVETKVAADKFCTTISTPPDSSVWVRRDISSVPLPADGDGNQIPRKPRPPPRVVALTSGPSLAVTRKRNAAAGARLEPMRPSSAPQQPEQRKSSLRRDGPDKRPSKSVTIEKGTGPTAQPKSQPAGDAVGSIPAPQEPTASINVNPNTSVITSSSRSSSRSSSPKSPRSSARSSRSTSPNSDMSPGREAASGGAKEAEHSPQDRQSHEAAKSLHVGAGGHPDANASADEYNDSFDEDAD